ncbi:hypothetical protein GC169_04045 [bacterium]|nr:hypothetical protein [bacterium]
MSEFGRRLAGVLATTGLCMAMTACEPAKPPGPVEDTSGASSGASSGADATTDGPPGADADAAAADPRFVNALTYTCEGGGDLLIVFSSGDQQTALVKPAAGAADGAPWTLPIEQDSGDFAYSDGTRRVLMEGPGIVWTAAGAAPRPCTHEARDLPPPRIADATHTITVADQGKKIEIATGETLAVALVGVPTAGYLWSAGKTPDFLRAAGESGGPTSTAQMLPGFAGGSHWEVLAFEVTGPGEGDLVLEQRRPWESDEPATDMFSVHIVAR